MTNYDTEFHLLYALATAVSTHKKAETQTHTRIQIADYDNALLPLRSSRERKTCSYVP